MPLIVKPISATLVKDADFFDKADPYVVIMIGNEKQRSRTCQGGGKNPTWTDTLSFNTKDNLMRIQVYDEDTFSKDDVIGDGTLNLNQFYSNPMRTENQYVDLVCGSRSAGRLLLSIQYQGQAMGGYGGPSQGYGQQGGYGQNQGGWGGNQGGWGGNQGGWGNQGGNQGGWGGNQGGYPANQGGWGGNQGGNQGGWGGNQGGYGPNQGGRGQAPNQGGWGGNQGGNQGGWGNQGGNQGGWNNNQGGRGWNNGW